MEIKFNFDERALKRAIQNAANDGVQKIGNRLQAIFDEVLASHGGQPVATVRPVLESSTRAADLTPSDEHLDAWSEAISEGRRIAVQMSDIQL
jgi:hypothetical protein